VKIPRIAIENGGEPEE